MFFFIISNSVLTNIINITDTFYVLVSHIHNNTFQFLNHIAMFKSLQVAKPCQGLIHIQFN